MTIKFYGRAKGRAVDIANGRGGEVFRWINVFGRQIDIW